MAATSLIEWTDATWNPITGCTLVSEGCRHCYAARLAATRLRHHPSRAGLARLNAAGAAKFTGEVRFNAQWLCQPEAWARPRRIFVCAHGDLFHEAVPDIWIDDVFRIMGGVRRHTFQVLTKRPERMRAYMTAVDPQMWVDFWAEKAAYREGHPQLGIVPAAPVWPPANVWLGTSVEDQTTADVRVRDLIATPAVIRFVSAEPLLGPWDTRRSLDRAGCDPVCGLRQAGIHWLIVGGESGPGARPMHPDWVRQLRDQCAGTSIPFFFKQWGKTRAGRLLDGREHNDMPGGGPC